MATYFKYAERSATSQVNWAEIGKNLTDTLQEENRIREEKKAAIDEASRQYGITLEKSPQGENTSLNQWGLDYAAQAQEARLLQDRLLKSGKLKLRDYTIMRQNLTDGTSDAFGLIDEYNAEYKEKMERAKSMDPTTASQYLESWLMEQVEGFSNFKNSKLFINPTTYTVNIGKVKTNSSGVQEMSSNPDDFTTVNELRNRIKSRYDKFDTKNYLKQQVDMLGKEIQEDITKAASKSQTGFTTSKEDIRLRKGFEDAQNAMIDAAFAGSPTNASSILTNDLGLYTKSDGTKVPFTFTFDETLAGENVIYLKNVDGKVTPQLDEDQTDLAREYMKSQMNMMLNYQEQMKSYNNPTPIPQQQWQYEAKNNKTLQQDMGRMLAYLHSGTKDQIQTAVDYFDAISPGSINKFKRDTGGISFVDSSGNFIKVQNTNDFDDFVRKGFVAVTGTSVGEADAVRGANRAGIKKDVYQSWEADEVFESLNVPGAVRTGGGGGASGGNVR